MALPSTLHHFDVALAHVDRGIEQTLSLKAARHPSETLDRLWLRVLALLWQWEEGIAFGPGLCEPDAPDVLAKRLDGTTALVVRVGRPEPERVLRDVTRGGGARVAVLFDSPRRLDGFLDAAREGKLERLAQADLAALDPAFLAALAAEESRRVRATFTLVGDHVYAEVGGKSVDSPLIRGRY
jgi:uncharacterized protein YaeQ